MVLHALALAVPYVFFLAAGLSLPAAQNDKPSDKDKEKRPAFSLKASPTISFAPAKVSLTGELKGGADDYEEYYCASVEWDWGDGTKSESSTDCAPYEAGKSEIRRRFTMTHVFRNSGNYRVQITLKRRDKTVVSANTTVQVQAGIRERSFGY
jgi:hypothetical protein